MSQPQSFEHGLDLCRLPAFNTANYGALGPAARRRILGFLSSKFLFRHAASDQCFHLGDGWHRHRHRHQAGLLPFPLQAVASGRQRFGFANLLVKPDGIIHFTAAVDAAPHLEAIAKVIPDKQSCTARADLIIKSHAVTPHHDAPANGLRHRHFVPHPATAHRDNGQTQRCPPSAGRPAGRQGRYGVRQSLLAS